MDPLITPDEAAALLKVSRSTIMEYERAGILRRVKLPSIRYSAKQIQEAIGVDAETLTPFMLKKAQAEIKELRAENERLNEQLNVIKRVLI